MLNESNFKTATHQNRQKIYKMETFNKSEY